MLFYSLRSLIHMQHDLFLENILFDALPYQFTSLNGPHGAVLALMVF